MASTLSSSLQDQTSAIIRFADDLQSPILSSISSGELIVTDDTLRALAEHLNQLPLPSSILSTQTRRQLDSSGTQLWNTCMRVMAACGECASEHGVLSKLQYFAFAMLESVAPRRGSGNLRALELALRTVKLCLENEPLEPSLKALEAAAERLEMLKISESNAGKSKLSTMTTEYYMLRIYLSWLQGRPDIAEHLFSKISKTPGSHAEKKVILEICCAVGMSALSKDQFDKSVRWLERALESSSWTGQQGEQPDLALKDMRLLALHTFVRAHLQLNETASWSHIYQSLNSLRAEYRDILPVVMLRLEVFSKEKQLNDRDYFQCLQHMVRMMDVTEESLMVAFYHIKKLGSLNWEHSKEIFQWLLLEKITLSGNQAWAEQYFVAFIWMVTSTKQPAQQDLGIIAGISKEMMERGCSPFSEEACHASLALIWRRIEYAISNHDLLVAEQWCLVVLEKPLFQNCSLVNRAIFQRKLNICAIENKNTPTTHDMVKSILEQSQDTPSTLYLVYKMALLHQWHDLERIALDALYRLGVNGSKYILLCAALLEAQCLGKI